MFSKLFMMTKSPANGSVIFAVHAAKKPNIFKGALTGTGWHHASMAKTLACITDEKKFIELQKQAVINLSTWTRTKISPPAQVDVVYQDWGIASQEATQKYGVIYAVLNMASATFPGGSVLEGGSAQEENMWHRSTAARSLLGKDVYLDKTSSTFLYKEMTQQLIEAKIKMTAAELSNLSQKRGEELHEAYKVFLNPQQMFCFRGPEIFVPAELGSMDGKNGQTADIAMSFAFLSPDQIFPFYEFRSSAPECTISDIDLSDQEILEQYKRDIRRRIAAQLDTLILTNNLHVILGAWGCGAFENNPDIVAKIYAEEITQRSLFFQHIIFPIITTDAHKENFNIFYQHLDGLKLGHYERTIKPAI